MKKILIGLMIIFSLAACHRQPKYEELLQKSQILIEKGRYYQAFKLLKRAKKQRPNDEKVWFLLGEVSLWSGKPYQAIRYFETTLGINPKQPKAMIKLGYLYLVTGYYDKARHLAQELLRFDPQNVYANLILGNVEALKGNLEKAKGYFKKALELHPTDFHCYLELGDFYLLCREPQKALSAYQKAQELAPKRPEVYLALGNFYIHQKKWARAEEALKQAIQYAPSPYEVRSYRAYLAEFYVEAGRTQKAFNLYQELLKEEPSNYYFLVRYTEISLNLGHLQEAEKALKILGKTYPELFAVPYLKGHLFLIQGCYKDAIAFFQEALTKGEDPRAYYFLGIAQWLSGLPRQARNNLAKAVTKNPLLLDARLALAALETAEGSPSLALKELEFILPSRTEAHALALTDHLLLKDCEGAKKEWQFLKKLDLDPQKKDFWGLIFAAECGVPKIRRDKKSPLAAWIILREKPNFIPSRIYGPEEALKALKYSLYAEKGDWLKIYQALSPQDPQEPALRYVKALALLKQGKREEAILLLEKVVSEVPEFVPAQSILGELYMESGEMDKAAEAFKQALVYDPQNATLLNNLAWCLLKMPSGKGNLEEALPVAERARELAPEDPAVLDTLAMVYHLSGMKEVACRTIREAKELSHGNTIILEHFDELCGTLVN